MTSHRFSIDCHEEEARFRGMLGCESPERVMAIRADGESGKSHFVQRLARLCLDADPRVPASVVDFAEFREGEPLELLRAIRAAFGRTIDFDNFDRLLGYLDMGVWNPAVGLVDVRGASFEGATDVDLTGVRIEQPQGPVTVAGVATIELADEKALKAARAVCQRAFFDALAAACAERPAVLILDTYEQCADAVTTWLERELLERFLETAWPERLVLVVAGRTIPRFEDEWPQRLREEQLVFLDGLGTWRPEDIKAGFLEVGFSQVPDVYDQIVTFLDLGATPGQLVGLMQLAGDPSSAGRG